MNEIRRKEFFVLLGAIAAAVGLFFLIRPVVQTAMATPRMLRAVGLEAYPGLRRIDYSEWTDPLHYCSGYEIMAFSVDGNRFVVPDGWETSDEPVDIEDFDQRYHTDIYVDELLALGGDECVAWRFVDHRDESIAFDQRDYYLAYCDRNGGTDRLFIYRGHHLYGFWDWD